MKSLLKTAASAMVIALLAGCTTPYANSNSSANWSKQGVPAALSGVWVGAEYDDQTKQARPVQIDLRINDLGRVEYSTPGCSGMVKYQRHEGEAMIFLEQIENGYGCPRNSYVRLQPKPDGSLRYAHFDMEGKRVALGEVRRSSQVQQVVDSQLDQEMLGTWSGPALTHNGRKTRAEVTITNYGRSQATYRDLGCVTELRHGAVNARAIAMVETPIQGNAGTCVQGVVTYALKEGRLVRMNFIQGQGIINSTVLNKVR